jgi:hypothetical protein
LDTSTLNEDADGTNANTGLVVVEPLARKYWNIAGNFYFFGQLATPLLQEKKRIRFKSYSIWCINVWWF